MISHALGFLKKHWLLTLVSAIFVAVFSLISLVNHYVFRTNGYDLGIFNHAIYDHSLFRVNQATLIQPFSYLGNILQDHFSLTLIVFAPLRYIFGTYTLLIVQIIALFIGGWGVRRYLSLYTSDNIIPILGQIHLFVSWGVVSALGFDYHDSVVGAMIVPHLLFYVKTKHWKGVYFTLFLILFCRVEFAIWLFFICMAQVVFNMRSKAVVKAMSLSAILVLLYFTLVIAVVLPALGGEGYVQFKYSILGDSIPEAIQFAVLHPFDTLGFLFVDHFDGGYDDFLIKRDYYVLFLLSGGFLMILKPEFIVMLFPIVMQKMLNDSTNKWGISAHYSIETVVLISMCAFSVLAGLKNVRVSKILSVFLILVTAFSTQYFIKHRHPVWVDTTSENFLIAWHYTNDFDVAEMHRALKLVPDNAKVSAQLNLTPHLSFRDVIYLFPHVSDAEYIVLNEKTSKYPMIKEAYFTAIETYLQDPLWDCIYQKNSTYIFKRVSSKPNE